MLARASDGFNEVGGAPFARKVRKSAKNGAEKSPRIGRSQIGNVGAEKVRKTGRESPIFQRLTRAIVREKVPDGFNGVGRLQGTKIRPKKSDGPTKSDFSSKNSNRKFVVETSKKWRPFVDVHAAWGDQGSSLVASKRVGMTISNDEMSDALQKSGSDWKSDSLLLTWNRGSMVPVNAELSLSFNQ